MGQWIYETVIVRKSQLPIGIRDQASLNVHVLSQHPGWEIVDSSGSIAQLQTSRTGTCSIRLRRLKGKRG